MKESQEPNYIVVVGASAGGLNSVIELIAQITNEINASVFVVLHFHTLSSHNIILQRLQSHTSFTCKMAENGEVIQKEHIYIAMPDKHLLIEKGKIILGQGPYENRWRPSIDVLFRSAAAAYDSRVIGVVLSGLMQDGTSGMIAIKRCGGTCIVQDPAEAEYPDMILSVLDNMKVDYCVSLESMGAILQEKTKNGKNEHAVPSDIKAEAEISARMAVDLNEVKKIGEKGLVSCPDCGGGLWEMVNDNIVRYRCHTGHVYTENELLIRHSEALEGTLWTALRMMEERRILLDKMANEENKKGWKQTAANKLMRAEELKAHINRLKEILFESKKD